jgi:8-oxo-dGTP pyrophosphatase MutT (NUDIX family)
VGDGIRAAASLVVGRDGRSGLELLVVERSPASRFLPGYAVFPGGAVEPQDAELASRWWGSTNESSRACALRELAEEAGLVMTGFGLISGAPLAAADDWPPSLDQLAEIARWIAPERVPVRFDARYYAAGAAVGVEPLADGAEVASVWWGSPGTLIREWKAGDRRLYWPTLFTMTQLAACSSVADLMRLRLETREPDDDELARLPRSTFWQD